jgi:hypothetical protein
VNGRVAGFSRLLDRILSHLMGATLATLIMLDSTLVVLRVTNSASASPGAVT